MSSRRIVRGASLILLVSLALLSEYQILGKRVGRRVKKVAETAASAPPKVEENPTGTVSTPPPETPAPAPKPRSIPVPSQDTRGKRGQDIPEIDEKEMKGVESRGGTRSHS